MRKVYGEHTRPTNEPALCTTCSAATQVRGTRFGDDVLRCHVLGRVTFHVTACSSYSDARLIPLYRLEDTAWRWMPDLDRLVSPGEFLRLNGNGVQASTPQAPNPPA
jgi:hypothetical protein